MQFSGTRWSSAPPRDTAAEQALQIGMLPKDMNGFLSQRCRRLKMLKALFAGELHSFYAAPPRGLICPFSFTCRSFVAASEALAGAIDKNVQQVRAAAWYEHTCAGHLPAAPLPPTPQAAQASIISFRYSPHRPPPRIQRPRH